MVDRATFELEGRGFGTILETVLRYVREQAYALEVWERDDVASGSVSPLSEPEKTRG